MPQALKQYPLNNLSLKVLALIFGYTLWQTMSTSHKVKVSLRAPISFYNEQNLTIDAPESIMVSLQAHRGTLYELTRDLAVHIDAKTLSEGNNTIALNQHNLFLPEAVKLLNCKPSTVTISVLKS